MSSSHYVAFWNLENLFDVADSPRRSEKLQRAVGKDVQDWTEDKLNAKVGQLSSIIRQMNQNRGPDLLGTCEVENEYVLGLLGSCLSGLLNRNYQVAHADTSDQRGIDVAFIYDADRFTFQAKFNHFVMRRTGTRELFQVNLKTAQDRLLVVVGNHWPSRSGGRYESAAYRAVAGETLAYFHERILQEHGEETPVLAMGDFNDEPFDPSLQDYALATRSRTIVLKARIPRFLNLMWPAMGQRTGTFFFESCPNLLDQFLANRNLLRAGSPISVDLDSVEVLHFPEMVKPGPYPAPIPFGGMGKPVKLDGFSDHFPIAVHLIEQ